MRTRTDNLIQTAADFGIVISPDLAEKLVRLAEMVVTANERMRLTAITAWEEVLVKHLLDSLAPLALGCPPGPGQRVADLGSGGGFPGLALAAAIPEASFTLIEATRKKADFLRAAAATLDLANVAIWPKRSEAAVTAEGREVFELVTARAVAELRVLVELAFPLLRLNGKLLAWKGPEAEKEIKAAENAFAKLGGEIRATRPYDLPAGMGRRYLISVTKVKHTPDGFPRRPGMAEKRPL